MFLPLPSSSVYLPPSLRTVSGNFHPLPSTFPFTLPSRSNSTFRARGAALWDLISPSRGIKHFYRGVKLFFPFEPRARSDCWRINGTLCETMARDRGAALYFSSRERPRPRPLLSPFRSPVPARISPFINSSRTSTKVVTSLFRSGSPTLENL